MERNIRFGIIGCGVISSTHAKSITELPGTELVAVCDIIEEKAKTLAHQFPARVYTDFQELLASDDIAEVDQMAEYRGLPLRQPDGPAQPR